MKEILKQQVVKIIATAVFAVEWEGNKRSRSNAYQAMHNGQKPDEATIKMFKKELRRRVTARAEEAYDAFFYDDVLDEEQVRRERESKKG